MKSSCTRCGGHIEYDESAAGADITCPHCKEPTRLPNYAAEPPPLVGVSPVRPVPASPPRSNQALIIGLVVGGVILLMVFFFGLLAAIAVPNFVKARKASQRAACVNHLRAIDGAKAIWALENKKENGSIPGESDLFGPGKALPARPACPAGGAYSANPVGVKPSCTIADHSF